MQFNSPRSPERKRSGGGFGTCLRVGVIVLVIWCVSMLVGIGTEIVRGKALKLSLVLVAGPDDNDEPSQEMVTSLQKWSGNSFGEGTVSVNIIAVYPSLSHINGEHKGIQVLQPCPQRKGSCRAVVSYTDLVNHALQNLPYGTTHVMLLSRSHVPKDISTLAGDLLIPFVENATTGVVGCTIVSTANSTSPSRVLEHGITVGSGFSTLDSTWAPFLLKQHAGFTTTDQRVRVRSSVTAVSPYCMMVPVVLVKKLGGFRRFTVSLSEQVALGQLSDGTAEQEIQTLRTTITDTVAVVAHSPTSKEVKNQKRTRVETLQVIREALTLLDKLGVGFVTDELDDESHSAYSERQLQELTSTVKTDSEIISYYEHMSQLADRIVNMINSIKIRRHSAKIGIQEEGGWDLCIRLKQRGFSVVVVPTAVAVNVSNMHPMYRSGVSTKSDTEAASYEVVGPFQGVWGSEITRFWPGHRGGQPPLLRIVWQTFCCHCCGFANEILHLVFPLQTKHAVELIPAPDCFCQGYPSAVIDSLERMHKPTTSSPLRTLDSNEIVVWVSHTDPGSYLSAEVKNAHVDYVVGRSMYEFTKIPKRWVHESQDNADEIWVPSTFVRDVWVKAGVDPKKVTLIPEAVDVFFFDPTVAGKVSIPLPSSWKHFNSMPNMTSPMDNFRFLSHFKWEDRKGWDVLLRAYFKAFNSSSSTSLYILTHIWFPGPPETHGDVTNHSFVRDRVLEVADSLRIKHNDLPHFVIITSRLSEEDVAALYNTMSGFVLPTRGEGWGLPPLQAMSLGIPTAVTNWSGPVDFLDPEYSFPIAVTRVEEIPKNSYYGYTKGKSWAVPSVDDTVRILKLMSDPANKNKLRLMGQRARQEVVKRYSEEAVAEIVSRRFDEIKKIIVAGEVPKRVPKQY
eukprot:TRINITY_DN3337_c5_g1_i1.p1 TRINITY_DN3337_c5_g1~~TRINITY_DN3337_c5_g1_i1.p1  ORF type:complete len:902 (+),score=153.83 TRINITY_DN3337_c5_g1_i1:108-2813(+)